MCIGTYVINYGGSHRHFCMTEIAERKFPIFFIPLVEMFTKGLNLPESQLVEFVF